MRTLGPLEVKLLIVVLYRVYTGPLEEQPVTLTAKPSLQPLCSLSNTYAILLQMCNVQIFSIIYPNFFCTMVSLPSPEWPVTLIDK